MFSVGLFGVCKRPGFWILVWPSNGLVTCPVYASTHPWWLGLTPTNPSDPGWDKVGTQAFTECFRVLVFLQTCMNHHLTHLWQVLHFCVFSNCSCLPSPLECHPKTNQDALIQLEKNIYFFTHKICFPKGIKVFFHLFMNCHPIMPGERGWELEWSQELSSIDLL